MPYLVVCSWTIITPFHILNCLVFSLFHPLLDSYSSRVYTNFTSVDHYVNYACQLTSMVQGLFFPVPFSSTIFSSTAAAIFQVRASDLSMCTNFASVDYYVSYVWQPTTIVHGLVSFSSFFMWFFFRQQLSSFSLCVHLIQVYA